MADRVTVSWRGGTYEAVRQDGPEWRVTHGGAPVTSFPAEPGEAAAGVRRKILEWLEGNASRPPADVGRQ